MGNLHRVLQVKPAVHIDGAVLRVKPGVAGRARRVYNKIKKRDYTEFIRETASVRVNNINIDQNIFNDPDENEYLVVQSGGKWGYDDALINLLAVMAPYLEDSLFYIDDEYQGYVEEFSIKDDTLKWKTAVEEGSTAFEYAVKKHSGSKKILFDLHYKMSEYLAAMFEYNCCQRDAMTHINKALEIRPESWDAMLLKGYIYLSTGKDKSAVATCKKALRLRGKSGDIEKEHLGSSGFYSFQDDHNGSISDFYKRIYQYLGSAYINMEEYDKALEYLKEAAHIVPTWGDYTPQLNMAHIFLNKKMYDDAIGLCTEMIEKSSDREIILKAFYNRSCAYALRGETGKALFDLKVSIEMDDSFKAVARNDDDLTAVLGENRQFVKLTG
jgi:tetratricopeptide (TPR) repeat protein